MMNPMEMNIAPQPRRPGVLLPILVGVGAFAVGTALTFGYVQWKSQQQQMALMTRMFEQMQQPAVVPSPAPVPAVTRSAPVDLLAVTTPQPAPRSEAVAVQVAFAAPAPAPASKTDEALARSTADRIRALVARSSDPLVSAAIAQDVARRETMSVAIQGVNELVDAAVAGNYSLTTVDDADGQAAGLRITFEGHEADQSALERLLSSAASAGMIAFNASVRGSDGSYDGQVILFDLVERALVNGSPQERRTGEAIRQQALALLGNNQAVAATAPANDAGDRYYVVESGDSLAYIALQFYGNTNAYLRIFKANESQLSSPEKIQIGQRLLIPSA